MCGVYGHFKLKGGTFDRHFKGDMTVLAINSKDRGHHATGIVYFEDNEKLVYHKEASPSNEFVKSANWRKLKMPDTMIGHTRWYTKGLPTNNDNNHPIIGNNSALVHNGVISNDDELFKEKNLHRLAQVDSEIILRLLEHNAEGNDIEDAIKLTSKELVGKFACAYLTSKRKNELFLFAHDNPIVLGYIEELGVIVFASEQKFIETAFSKMTQKLGYFTDISPRHKIIYQTMVNDTGMVIDENGISSVFTIEAKKPQYTSSFGYHENWREASDGTFGKYVPLASRNALNYIHLYSCPYCSGVNTLISLYNNGNLCNVCQGDLTETGEETAQKFKMLDEDWADLVLESDGVIFEQYIKDEESLIYL